MENPVEEISDVIHLLTQAPTYEQLETIETYFTSNATFTHPFCRTLQGSSFSKVQIYYIYRWYKIMSPEIEISINSVAFDRENLILYVSMHQIFRIFVVPFYKAPVSLVTVLKLEYVAGKYYINSQNDLYQTDEFIKFVAPWGGARVIQALQLMATLFCILGAVCLWPLGLIGEWLLIGTKKAPGMKQIQARGKGKERAIELETWQNTSENSTPASSASSTPRKKPAKMRDQKSRSEEDLRQRLKLKRSVSFEDAAVAKDKALNENFRFTGSLGGTSS